MEENPKKIKQNTLTEKEILKIFGNKKITVKELLKGLSLQFKMEDLEKTLLRTFLKEKCEAKTDEVTGETVFKVKSKK